MKCLSISLCVCDCMCVSVLDGFVKPLVLGRFGPGTGNESISSAVKRPLKHGTLYLCHSVPGALLSLPTFTEQHKQDPFHRVCM